MKNQADAQQNRLWLKSQHFRSFPLPLLEDSSDWALHTDCSALHWLTPVSVLQLKVKPAVLECSVRVEQRHAAQAEFISPTDVTSEAWECLCVKKSSISIIAPTCCLSGVAMETRRHDEAQQQTPAALHDGYVLKFFSS